MALRFFIQQGSSSVAKTSVNPKLGLWVPQINRKLWDPSPSISCFLHSNGSSSVPSNPGGDFIKTQDNVATALCCGGTSIYKGAQKDEWIISLAQFAVTKQNEAQNSHLQFVRVVGASHTGVCSLLYHITLEATVARKQKIYHAIVWLQLWRNLMDLLVWKPVNDALSAVGVKRGDLKLHEAVMFYMNQMKKDLPGYDFL